MLSSTISQTPLTSVPTLIQMFEVELTQQKAKVVLNKLKIMMIFASLIKVFLKDMWIWDPVNKTHAIVTFHRGIQRGDFVKL